MDTLSANAMEGQRHHHSNAINEEKWENAYRRLKAFKEMHGHTQLSYRHNDDPKLGRWGTLTIVDTHLVADVLWFSVLTLECQFPFSELSFGNSRKDLRNRQVSRQNEFASLTR